MAGAGNERRVAQVILPANGVGESEGTLKTEPKLGVDRGGTLRYSPLPFGAPARRGRNKEAAEGVDKRVKGR